MLEKLKQRADEFKWTDDADVLPGEISDTVRRATEQATHLKDRGHALID